MREHILVLVAVSLGTAFAGVHHVMAAQDKAPTKLTRSPEQSLATPSTSAGSEQRYKLWLLVQAQ